jgi:hypothetical protein
MAKYVVEIGDEGGKSFKVEINLGFMRRTKGDWKTLDKGFIRFNSGGAERNESVGELSGAHLFLLTNDNTWGIRLNDWDNFFKTNNHGTGWAEHSWVLGLRNGRISWTIVT